MTEKSSMAHSVIIRKTCICRKLQNSLYNSSEILIHNLAFCNIYNIVKAASFMHAKCKRSVLIFVSKRKFHFIAICLSDRTFFNTLPDIITINRRIHHCMDLRFLHLHLLFIRQILISASATDSKMRTCRLTFFR